MSSEGRKVVFTLHARDRLRERAGLTEREVEVIVQRALAKGVAYRPPDSPEFLWIAIDRGERPTTAIVRLYPERVLVVTVRDSSAATQMERPISGLTWRPFAEWAKQRRGD